MNTDNPIPLLPCPWCGSEDLETHYDDQDVSIQCSDCGACGPCNDDNEQAEAIAAWNKGPYADRFEIHAAALKAHADALREQAVEHQAKADELLKRAAKVTT